MSVLAVQQIDGKTLFVSTMRWKFRKHLFQGKLENEIKRRRVYRVDQNEWPNAVLRCTTI